jgi:hypothetical protein
VHLVVASVLIVEALGTALWLAGRLDSLLAFGALVVLFAGARAVVGVLQFTGGWLLFSKRPQAPAFARAAIVSSAVVTTVDVAWRITPSDLDPSHRWIVIVSYLAWSGLVLWYLRQMASASVSAP